MKWIAFLLASLMLAACGSNERAGGSGVDIPNSITLLARHGDGSPVVQGNVRIVADSKWMYYKNNGTSVVLDSTQTDEKGRFEFTPPTAETVRIEIISEKEGISNPYEPTQSVLTLEALGSVQAQWKPGALLTVVGSSFSERADQNGFVEFTYIPRIKSEFVGEELDSTPAILSPFSLQPSQSLNMGVLQEYATYLSVDDFERKSKASNLEPFVHGSYWFSLSDEQVGGQSTIYPSTSNNDSWILAISDSNSFHGNSLTIRYSFRYSDSGSSFVIFGCTLGNGINSSAIDSISFSAFTNGEFVMTDGVHPLLRGASTLNSGWQKFTVHRKELDSLNVDKSLEVLQFLLNDPNGSEFRLDDFSIYGDPFELLIQE